ncbi:MAG: sugar transferase [Christensenellaceae bacterium]|nr:sugar transferase [Christensenellaceae bacterium]
MIKRLFDIVASFLGLVILIIPFIIVSLMIALTSRGGVFYKQIRIGKHEKEFKIIKFRTMVKNSDNNGLLITTHEDNRITSIGKFLRKTKIDELPQLINVFLGQMSFVGPRPEVPKYVMLYNVAQRKVLSVKPGITDPASIIFRDENQLLNGSDDPEEKYISDIMPKKLEINLEYINRQSFLYDIKIIFMTLAKIFRH